MTTKDEWKQPWLPSTHVRLEMLKYDYFPHVRVVPRFTSKDVEFRAQKTRSSSGAKYQIKLFEMPIEHVLSRDEVDQFWLKLLLGARKMIDHEDLPDDTYPESEEPC